VENVKRKDVVGGEALSKDLEDLDR